MTKPTSHPSTPSAAPEETTKSLAERLTTAFGSPPTKLADMSPEDLTSKGLAPLLALARRDL